jgi:hypothetical protein
MSDNLLQNNDTLDDNKEYDAIEPRMDSWGHQSDADIVETEVKKKGPVSMSPVGKTYSFPREDNIFLHKESLPYDEIQTQVWKERPR